MDAVQDSSRKQVKVKLACEYDLIFVEVQDLGSGISPELYLTIFDKGFSTKADNRGFGLALVKKVLERRSGTITLTSAVAQGTVFQIKIPYDNKEVSKEL
jgi:CitB family two-component system sensor histidine kinase MalK